MMRPAIGFKDVPAELGLQRGTGRWDGMPARPPKKGEFYLSGASPVAYRAPNDLSTPYFIAIVTTKDGVRIGKPAPLSAMDVVADQIERLADDMKKTAQELRMAAAQAGIGGAHASA